MIAMADPSVLSQFMAGNRNVIYDWHARPQPSTLGWSYPILLDTGAENPGHPIFLSERGVQVQPVAEYLLRNPSYALSSSIMNSSNSAIQRSQAQSDAVSMAF
jgi:hypothetical protein